jgi:VanZ family protein
VAFSEVYELSRLIPYLPAFLCAAAILAVGSLHRVPHPPSGLQIDKLAHFGMYGILGLLTGRGWLQNGRRPALFIPILLAIAVGAADEIHQSFNPDRSADVLDLLADTAGVAAGFTWIVRRNAALSTGTR